MDHTAERSQYAEPVPAVLHSSPKLGEPLVHVAVWYIKAI
jgi:hypothetical protein